MPNQEKRIFVVDSQKLNSAQMCARLYSYKFGRSLESETIPIQFEKGTLIHAGLEFYYKAKQVRQKWDESGLTHADIVDQCIEHIRTTAISMAIDMEEVENVIRVFREYTTHYANDGWDIINTVENTGSKILYEDDNFIFLYEFKIDLTISLPNLPLIAVDHKSYSRKSYTSDMVNQFIGYCWALDINNLMVNKIGFQKTVKPEEKFTRDLLSYSDARIEEWVNNSVFWLKQIIAYIEMDYFPMNLTSCDKYSGCSFRSVCTKDPESREDVLKQLFQIQEKNWDVGAHLE